jgi:hypothetical protein
LNLFVIKKIMAKGGKKAVPKNEAPNKVATTTQ